MTVTGIVSHPSDLHASRRRRPASRWPYWVTTIGCSKPISSMLLASAPMSPFSCRKRLPILIEFDGKRAHARRSIRVAPAINSSRSRSESWKILDRPWGARPSAALIRTSRRRGQDGFSTSRRCEAPVIAAPSGTPPPRSMPRRRPVLLGTVCKPRSLRGIVRALDGDYDRG